MKDKPFIYRDNNAIHDKIMRERVRLIITQRDIEFTLTHQRDTLEELSQYLRQCKKELKHIPARTEVVGGELVELRFGSWANDLKQSGFKDYTGAAVHTPALENTALYRAEYDRQQELHKQAKEERKKQAKENRREQKSAKKRAKKAAAAGGSK